MCVKMNRKKEKLRLAITVNKTGEKMASQGKEQREQGDSRHPSQT